MVIAMDGLGNVYACPPGTLRRRYQPARCSVKKWLMIGSALALSVSLGVVYAQSSGAGGGAGGASGSSATGQSSGAGGAGAGGAGAGAGGAGGARGARSGAGAGSGTWG